MTQAKVPGGAGSKEFVSNVPTDITWDAVIATTNNLRDGVQVYEIEEAAGSSSDFVFEFVAEDNGYIDSLRYANGSVAADGTNGWELSFLNISNSSDVVAYFGIGSGTEAAKASDVDTAVAANGVAEIDNATHKPGGTDVAGFNKGDLIRVTADRDGTTIVGRFLLGVAYQSAGRP